MVKPLHKTAKLSTPGNNECVKSDVEMAIFEITSSRKHETLGATCARLSGCTEATSGASVWAKWIYIYRFLRAALLGAWMRSAS